MPRGPGMFKKPKTLQTDYSAVLDKSDRLNHSYFKSPIVYNIGFKNFETVLLSFSLYLYRINIGLIF